MTTNKMMLSVVLFFIMGIMLGAVVTYEYYEDEGCKSICSQKLKFEDSPAYFDWMGNIDI